jgi:hypothetical protein
VTETKKGDLMFKLEMMPLLGLKEGAIWGYLNVPEEKSQEQEKAAPDSMPDDDIPF